MSVLLKQVKQNSKEAASVLEKAGFCTDSELQSLTREDLHELFPGPQKLKLRKTIFEIIHQQKPIDVLLRELRDFLPRESFRAALTNNGVLVDYLHILKEMKTQMNNVQTFLDAHIGLLEEFAKDQHQEPDKGSNGPVVPYCSQTQDQPLGDQVTEATGFARLIPSWLTTGSRSSGLKSSDTPVVSYQVVLGGKTFDAHKQLLDKVKAEGDWLLPTVSDQDCQIRIVFCPISSRVGSDVEAVMRDVKGDKPVILVLMHHKHDTKHTLPRTTLEFKYHNVVLQVDTLYHKTISGLLECRQNDDAAAMIQKNLMEYGIQERKNTSGNGHGGSLGGDCGSGHGGGNLKVSDSGSNASYPCFNS